MPTFPSSRSSSSAWISFPSSCVVTARFISDLHLTAGDAETTGRFAEFMAGPARAARELYILGDLFEAWIGDDDDDPRLKPIVAALRDLTRAGVACALMHGNRDFLL